MAQIPVINNHTGDEGEVDETWFERWPGDFTPLDPEHAALVADLLADGAEPTEDPAPNPETVEEPSDGNHYEEVS